MQLIQNLYEFFAETAQETVASEAAPTTAFTPMPPPPTSADPVPSSPR